MKPDQIREGRTYEGANHPPPSRISRRYVIGIDSQNVRFVRGNITKHSIPIVARIKDFAAWAIREVPEEE